MNRELHQKASDILSEALERAAEDRERFLRERCGDDAILLAHALTLLPYIQDVAVEGLPPLELSEGPATRVEVGISLASELGNYTLLEAIGSGATGTVYRARQERPLRREVAIKILKTPLATEALRARFDAEAQALARLDHPHIAKVFDAGTTTLGQPYFVMELVDGLRITDFADRERLDLRGRLQLFIEVCHAVHHAHKRGILHRDLKPDNILVSNLDGRPRSTIVDFGIAKAVGKTGAEESLHTMSGFPMGTVGYMSPEQTVSSDAIDETTDVYALGALLYELLVGTPPFAVSRGSPLDDVLREIRSVDPPRPSIRLKATGSDAVMAARRVTLPQLRSMLRTDVDWIVMRALERNPGRRYPSASAVALDVERYLRAEPVEARPPASWYRIGKFVRRRRGAILGVGAAALGVLGIGLAAIDAPSLLVGARARGGPFSTRSLAEQSLAFGVAAYERRDFETARASFRDAVGYDSTLAMAYFHWSQCEAFWEQAVEARRLAEKAFANVDRLRRDDRDLVESWYFLMTERPDEAIRVLENRVARHPKDADAWYQLARSYFSNTDEMNEAIRCYRKSIDLDPGRGVALNDLAYSYLGVGRPDSAIAWAHRLIALQPDEPNPYDTMGDVYRSTNADSAAAYYRVALQKKSDFVVPLEKLASLAFFRGRFAEAESLCTKMIASDDPIYRGKGRWFRTCLPIFRGHLRQADAEIAAAIEEDRHDRVPSHVSELKFSLRASVLSELGDHDRALAALDDAIRGGSSGRQGSPDRFRLMKVWALLQAGRDQEASSLANSLAHARHPDPRWDYVGPAAKGLIALREGRCSDAAALLSDAMQIQRRRDFELYYLRGEAFACAGEPENAAEDLERVVGRTATPNLFGPIAVFRAFVRLGELYSELGEVDRAKEAYGRVVAWWGDSEDPSGILTAAREGLAALGPPRAIAAENSQQ
jgi:serine/threonine protein kinase/tetratricopeptide (TPR) repeat protein